MTDTGEMVQTEMEAAIEHAQYVENDPAKASALYQKLIGSTDREGEAPAPVVDVDVDVPDEGQADAPAEPAGPSPADVDQGMGGGGMADYVSYDSLSEDEQDKVFDDMLSLSDPGVSEGILKREWLGDEYDTNREFVNAALMANSYGAKVVRILEAAGGVVNHPHLIRFMAEVGRALASKPGDPSSIPTNSGENKRMVDMNEIDIANFDEKTEGLMTEQAQAQAEGNTGKATRLEHEIRALFVKRYGSGPLPSISFRLL